MAKTALVTGAAQGIGAAIAARLAHDGFNVAVGCRSQASAEGDGAAVKAACEGFGMEAECFVCDVADFDACGETVKAVKERFGSIDVLVNNAGLTRDGLMARMTEEQYDEVIRVNQKGVFNMMRHCSGVMIKQRGGRIINLSSVAGVYGNAGQVNYAASKAAVIGMTLTGAKELGGRGITVNAVAPGFIETRMTADLPEKVREAALASIPLGRYGKPEEVAGAVSFLASDDAAYISGQVIVISGGMVL